VTLGHGSYEVEIAASVADAEVRVRAWRPRLLIVDLELKDGAPRLLGETAGTPHVPTIVLTVDGGLRTKIEAIDGGADDFITLPVDANELVARAHAAIRR
jgi:two-component system KDP operon response regulator KdpE